MVDSSNLHIIASKLSKVFCSLRSTRGLDGTFIRSIEKWCLVSAWGFLHSLANFVLLGHLESFYSSCYMIRCHLFAKVRFLWWKSSKNESTTANQKSNKCCRRSAKKCSRCCLSQNLKIGWEWRWFANCLSSQKFVDINQIESRIDDDVHINLKTPRITLLS